jgi:hypothetical protein
VNVIWWRTMPPKTRHNAFGLDGNTIVQGTSRPVKPFRFDGGGDLDQLRVTVKRFVLAARQPIARIKKPHVCVNLFIIRARHFIPSDSLVKCSSITMKFMLIRQVSLAVVEVCGQTHDYRALFPS